MANFKFALESIETIFGGSDWTANNIVTRPSSFNGSLPSNTTEICFTEVYPVERPASRFGQKTVGGYIEVTILTEAGKGQARSLEIADLLDEVLLNKVSGQLRLMRSALNPVGEDPRYGGKFRTDYRIPFEYS